MLDIITKISPGAPAVWVYARDLDDIYANLSDKNVSLIGVAGVDWDADLSPWRAKRAFKGGADFAGGADAHLAELMSAIPEIEAEIASKPPSRAICGYSLAGLFAIYAAHNCDMFDCAISASGSLWYDNFIAYLCDTPPRAARFYLSLGDKEPKTRNPRLAAVGECTLRAAEILREHRAAAHFEWNEGNHFANADKRLARGIDWYLSACTARLV